MESTGITTGAVQRHPRFYIPSGDIVIQVEKSIFKIHSYFLTAQSEVFHDMLAAPQKDDSEDGTEFKPLFLPGDQVEGWELFLSAIYRDKHLACVKYTGEQSIAVLRITHKYCMHSFEEELISGLKEETGTTGFLNLLFASRIVNSTDLYETALQGLKTSYPKPTLEEAKQIGVETYHAIMSQPYPSTCRNCQGTGNVKLSCGYCHYVY